MPELVLLGGPTADGLPGADAGADAAPDIVLIHGYGSDTQSWVGTAPALFSLGQVKALDLPGHGKAWAEKPANSMNGLVDQIEACVFNLSGRPVHIVAHSIGGTLAMLLAKRWPDSVASLVLLAPAGLGQNVNETFITRYPQLINEEDTLNELRKLVCNERLIPDNFARLVLDQLNREGVRQTLADLGSMILQAQEELNNAAEAIAQSEIPRLVVWGKQDRINCFNKNDENRFGGSWRIFEHCGHLPHIEHRVAVNETIKQFLTESE